MSILQKALREMPDPGALYGVLSSAYKEIIVPQKKKGLVITYKEDGSPQTTIDVNTEKHIKMLLGPEITIGEEDFNLDYFKSLKSFFITDPIDGTRNFLRLSKNWGMMLCRVENNLPVYGAMFFPELNSWVMCEKGKGVFSDKGKLSTPKQIPGFEPCFYSYESSFKGVSNINTRCNAWMTYELLHTGGALRFSASAWEYYLIVLMIKELSGKYVISKGQLGDESIDLLAGFDEKLMDRAA